MDLISKPPLHEWRRQQAGRRWPFLVKLYGKVPGSKWIGFSLCPALLESGLGVGGLSLAIVAWVFGLPIEARYPSIVALAGALLSLQVLWHILHLSSSDLVKLRWESAFENKKGKITIATILVIALILL